MEWEQQRAIEEKSVAGVCMSELARSCISKLREFKHDLYRSSHDLVNMQGTSLRHDIAGGVWDMCVCWRRCVGHVCILREVCGTCVYIERGVWNMCVYWRRCVGHLCILREVCGTCVYMWHKCRCVDVVCTW